MFILASQSPQRKEILQKLGVDFRVVPSNLDESIVEEEDPLERAKALAEAKAQVVSNQYPGDWVIGVDTLVVSEDGILLEKPADEEEAIRMMQLHSGKTSAIHSALCIYKCHGEHVTPSGDEARTMTSVSSFVSAQDDTTRTEKHTDVSSAFVTFRDLTEADIAWWISTGLWQNRSGAFQIEGEGEKLIEHLEGEYETVVGFPVQLFWEMQHTFVPSSA